MSVTKNIYPILEYDDEHNGIIKIDRHSRALLPPICIMTFFGEVLEKFVNDNKAKAINTYNSEMRKFPIYALNHKGIDICLMQIAVGSASASMMVDYLYGYGVKKIIACGCCAVLDDIPSGDVLIPVSALRDEGASYHYLPPAREIKLDPDIIDIIINTLTNAGVPFIECKTWTTDAFYRETPDMVAYRKEEGCSVVEMECSAMAAVARFRGIKFGQLLYSGDIIVDYQNYDDRHWYTNLTAREKLFYLALDVARSLV